MEYLRKAKEMEAEGELTQGEIHLINGFIGGDMSIFLGYGNGEWGEELFRAFWEESQNQDFFAALAEMQPLKYILDQMDQTDELAFRDKRRGEDCEPIYKTVWEYAPIVQLIQLGCVRYVVTIFVTTEGKVLSRGNYVGQFTKQGC